MYGEEFSESSDEEENEENEQEEKSNTLYEQKEENKENEKKDKIISNISLNFYEFYCHVYLFYEKELKEFSGIFINFIIERSDLTSFFESKTYSEKRTLSVFENKYLK